MNDMNGLSHKIYLELTPPGPGDSMSDQQRIAAALRAEWGEVKFPLPVLRCLYPLCTEAAWHITVTLGWNRGIPLPATMACVLTWAAPHW